jgi:hypothetical protein
MFAEVLQVPAFRDCAIEFTAEVEPPIQFGAEP